MDAVKKNQDMREDDQRVPHTKSPYHLCAETGEEADNARMLPEVGAGKMIQEADSAVEQQVCTRNPSGPADAGTARTPHTCSTPGHVHAGDPWRNALPL